MERIDRRAPNLATLMAAPRGLSANEIKGACVFPSRPRPTRRSTGRIHISDFRQHFLTCDRQPVHTFGSASCRSRRVLSARF
jgi:hypothetical protein